MVMKENVVILGASEKKDRYSNIAIGRLKEAGYSVLPVNPKLHQIDGVKVYNDLSEIQFTIHTLTVYVNPSLLEKNIAKIKELNPKRVILNPGTRSEKAKLELKNRGIQVVEACTLVMLSTNEF